MPTTRFFKILDTVDSTNNYAMAQVHAGSASHGMAWFAHEQTGGKGQRGKKWQSEPGKNIAMSVVLQPQQLNTTHQFFLSASMALACFDFFSAYAGNETKIKWPNDIFWCDRKAGGILIENIFNGKELKYAVVGIGININQINFGKDLKNPISLKLITGKDYDAISLAKELYELLIKKAAMLNSTQFQKTIKEYNNHLYKQNEKVKLKKENVVFETRIKEVSSLGKLITIDAMERQFDFGEVEWLS